MLEETDDVDLFSPEELDMVAAVRGAGTDAKKLYVRLFQRKHAWRTKEKMSYEEVADRDRALEELERLGLIDSGKLIE